MKAESNPETSWLRSHPQGCTISVRIQPGAKKNGILGIYGEGEEAALKIAIQAPPIEGRANEALIAWIARLLHRPLSQVDLLAGSTSRSKVLLLRGVTAHEARELLPTC